MEKFALKLKKSRKNASFLKNIQNFPLDKPREIKYNTKLIHNVIMGLYNLCVNDTIPQYKQKINTF